MGEAIELNGLVKQKKKVIRSFTDFGPCDAGCQAQTRYHAEMQSCTVWKLAWQELDKELILTCSEFPRVAMDANWPLAGVSCL